MCITFIFDNKISDARKSFHAVTRALKSHTAKLVLCQELSSHITGAKAVLNAQQFDMVVKLMHCALQVSKNAQQQFLLKYFNFDFGNCVFYKF